MRSRRFRRCNATRTTTRTRRSALVAAAAIAIALPLTLAACSTSGSGSGADTATASDGIGARWGSCVRDAGFDIEDPSDELVQSGAVAAPDGIDSEAFAKAAASCSDQLGVQAQDSATGEKLGREYQRVAECIRDSGYEDFDGYDAENQAIVVGDYPRADEPEFDEAFQKCLAEFSPSTQTMER